MKTCKRFKMHLLSQ